VQILVNIERINLFHYTSAAYSCKFVMFIVRIFHLESLRENTGFLTVVGVVYCVHTACRKEHFECISVYFCFENVFTCYCVKYLSGAGRPEMPFCVNIK
jgi:hypothetical protein